MIINRMRKSQDAIKTWNRMNPVQHNWINFKSHFCTGHRELEETSKLTMEAAGYHQANLVNYIVTHMSGLSFPYPPQDPEYTPTPNPAPTIVPTVQPTPVANVITDVSNIPPDTDQHETDASTSDSDADEPNRMGRTNKQLQYPHSPSRN